MSTHRLLVRGGLERDAGHLHLLGLRLCGLCSSHFARVVELEWRRVEFEK